MSTRRGLTPSEVERVRDGIRELISRHGGQKSAERETGVGQQLLSKYMTPANEPPGIQFAEELAIALGRHPAYFRDWFQSAPPEPRVVYDPRYPNFAEAARLFLGNAQAAIDASESLLKSEGDLEVSEWLAQMRAEQRRLGAVERDPVGTAKKATETAERAKVEEAELKRKVDAGETGAVPNWKKHVEELAKKAREEEAATETPRRSFVPSSEPEAPARKSKKT